MWAIQTSASIPDAWWRREQKTKSSWWTFLAPSVTFSIQSYGHFTYSATAAPSFLIREPAMSRPAWTTSIRGTLTNVWRNTQRRSVCDEPPGKVPAEFLQWLKYKKVWYLLHSYCTTVQKSLTSWCFETYLFQGSSLSNGFSKDLHLWCCPACSSCFAPSTSATASSSTTPSGTISIGWYIFLYW